MSLPTFPRGYRGAGRNVGIKNRGRDCGVLVSDRPANLALVCTRNRARGPNIDRARRLREQGGQVRAVLAGSGNANVLNGAAGSTDDQALAETLARGLGIQANEVLTAYTGVIGHPLPRGRIEAAIPKVLLELADDPGPFAQSILTTDRVPKVFVREVFVGGTPVRLHGVAKGAGMIAPSMATMLAFISTDAELSSATMQDMLREAVEVSFNALTVDDDMSTSDMVVFMANGRAGTVDADPEARRSLQDALTDLCQTMARAIASDGEGATRRLEVEVRGAGNQRLARDIAHEVAGSMLVKSAIFGADPNAGGRIIAAAGARAAGLDAPFEPELATLTLQDHVVFRAGACELHEGGSLRTRMKEPVIEVILDLGAGSESARAFGCDLTYEYVSINADYESVTVGPAATPDELSLSELGPDRKRRILIEALRYIDRFNGLRAVIKLGGAAMVDPVLERHFAESVLLLRSVGLRPVVVHGGGPEISRTLQALGRTTKFVDGLRVTDAESMPVVEMVLTGSVNQRLVAALNATGARAVGLSGKDGGLLRAKKLESEQDMGRVGEVDAVDTRLIELLEEQGYLPVVSPVGLGPHGASFNINADVVAARLATELSARKLIYLSDVAGLLDGDEVVSELTQDQLKARLDRGDITGGMKPKLDAALAALRSGVESVHLVDGRVPHNLIAELFTDRGVGTLIRQS